MNTPTQNNPDARAAASAKLAKLRGWLATDPDNARLRRDCVDTAVVAGEFEFVKQLAEQRLAATPSDAEARFDRATALIGLGDYAGALDANIPGVRFNLGLCHFMLRQWAQARAFFDAGYAAGERTPALVRFLLLTLHHLAELEAALAIVAANERVVASDAELAGTVSTLFIDSDDTVNAQRWARTALALNPDNIDALVSDATVRAAALDAAGAQAGFQRALAKAPDNGRAWVGLGSLTMLTGDFDAAGAQLQQAVAKMPTHLGSWHVLAWSHLFAGRRDEAERVWQHALELNHNFSETHGGLAIIAAMRGDRAAAERGIEVAERLDRNCNSSQYARYLLTTAEQGPDAGRQFLANAVAKLPVHGPQLAQMLKAPPNRGPKT